MELADPKLRIWKKPNIWNICIINNIDFKEKVFTYGNIYDATRHSFHATLRLLFQYQLPVELSSISNKEVQLNENMKLFSENLISNNISLIFDSIFTQLLLNCKIKNNLSIQFPFKYDAEIINNRIINHFNHGSTCPSVYVIIIKALHKPA
jgi:hypothetical protein